MKKLFAIVALAGAFTFGSVNVSLAQEVEEITTEQLQEAGDEEEAVAAEAEEAEEVATVAVANVEEESVSLHKNLKTKYIEGDAGFMTLVALALVLGLIFCIERFVFLSLSQINHRRLLDQIEALVKKGNVNAAVDLCRSKRGPVAAVCLEALKAIQSGKGLDVFDSTITSEAAVQSSYLEKNCSWITFCIATAPSLGFLGTVIGMVQAFDDIQKAGDISPTVVAGGMKVALITTIFGIVVAIILQLVYNFILVMIEGLVANMEDCSIRLIEIYAVNENVNRR